MALQERFLYPPFQIFVCIGFFDWLLLISLFVALLRHDRIGIMLTIPMIANILTLLIATPVYAEMRYNYAVFCALPIVISLVLRPMESKNDISKNIEVF